MEKRKRRIIKKMGRKSRKDEAEESRRQLIWKTNVAFVDGIAES